MVGGIFYWSLVILGGLGGWWDFLLDVGDFDARCVGPSVWPSVNIESKSRKASVLDTSCV